MRCGTEAGAADFRRPPSDQPVVMVPDQVDRICVMSV